MTHGAEIYPFFAAIDWSAEVPQLISTVVYFVLGLLLFGVGIILCDKLAPFSIRKEIEEDQNSALAILMGAGIIALAIIVAAVVR